MSLNTQIQVPDTLASQDLAPDNKPSLENSQVPSPLPPTHSYMHTPTHIHTPDTHTGQQADRPTDGLTELAWLIFTGILEADSQALGSLCTCLCRAFYNLQTTPPPQSGAPLPPHRSTALPTDSFRSAPGPG